MSRDHAPPPDDTRDRYGDANLTIDAHEDDWAWRRRIRANPHTHRLYRILVGVVGLIVVSGGAVMIPFPGPGWLVVFIGVGIWASEFEWAARLLDFGKRTLKSWNAWLQVQAWWVQGLVLLVTLVAVALIFWGLFLVSGVPGFFPDFAENWLHAVPGL
jgi:uncharacterized protein (TIGR02611 family)